MSRNIQDKIVEQGTSPRVEARLATTPHLTPLPLSNAEREKRSQRPADVLHWVKVMPLCLLTVSAWAQTSTTNALPALAPAYGEMKPVVFGKYEVPEFWAQHEVLIIFTGLLVAVSAGLLVWLMLRPGVPVATPAGVVARTTLGRLSGQPEDGKVLSEISQALRRYIIQSFQLPVGELTTGEFSGALAGNEKIGPELAESVMTFLRECDERKFSAGSPQTGLNAASRALELVSQGESRRREQAAPTLGEKA